MDLFGSAIEEQVFFREIYAEIESLKNKVLKHKDRTEYVDAMTR